ncbi:hypothetical protein CMU13_12720 [Elizabethkingia anophelis]|nr:hypothetical protein [Elizabethkingia anophelis]
MATFEQRQQTQKAQMIVDKYKECNKSTIEQVKTYDPVLRCWYFKKLKIDENAKNMTSYLKGVERENKAKEKRIKESRTGRIKIESKPIIVSKKKSKTIAPSENALYYKVGHDLYKNNMTMHEVSEKYNLKPHSVKQHSYKYAKALGLNTKKQIEVNARVETIINMYKKGDSMCKISKDLKMCRKAIKSILLENGIELSPYKKAA